MSSVPCLWVLVVSLITYLNQVVGATRTYDIGNFSAVTVIYVFVAAMIAISAMVLPGISGSTLLLKSIRDQMEQPG